MRKLELHWQILIALVLAMVLGVIFDEKASLFGVSLVAVLGFVGDLFLQALKMLVLPLIMASIITGVAGVGDHEGVGRLGLRTALYYFASSLVAILIGLTLVVVIQPGIVDGEPAKELIGLSADVGQVVSKVEGRGAGDIVDVFLRMIPENVLRDAADGEMLGVIVFSILFGLFTSRISEEPRRVLTSFWQGVYEVMLKMTDAVLLLLRWAFLGWWDALL